MLRSFTYLSPRTLDEAIVALQQPGAHALAGGTDFVVHLRSGALRPTQVVDLHDLGLAYVREDDGKVTIGALTTFNEILASPVLHREVPALVEAAAHIGATQCRNMATIGGNLCSAVPSADSAPPLLVREATLRIVGPTGERTSRWPTFLPARRRPLSCQERFSPRCRYPGGWPTAVKPSSSWAAGKP